MVASLSCVDGQATVIFLLSQPGLIAFGEGALELSLLCLREELIAKRDLRENREAL